MGLNTRGGSRSNVTYINVFQGNMVLEYQDEDNLKQKLESLGLDDEHIKVRQRTKGRHEGQDVYYYVLFDVSGKLTGLKMNETDFGEFVEIEITDLDEKFVISLGDVGSRISKDFVRRMENINLDEELVFGVWSISAEEADNGKPKSGVRIYQDDKKLEYSIQYDEMPEPETKKRGRKTVWDFTEQENFLYEALVSWKEENFQTGAETVKEDVKEEVKDKPVRKKRGKATKDTKEDTNDDLPF